MNNSLQRQKSRKLNTFFSEVTFKFNIFFYFIPHSDTQGCKVLPVSNPNNQSRKRGLSDKIQLKLHLNYFRFFQADEKHIKA